MEVQLGLSRPEPVNIDVSPPYALGPSRSKCLESRFLSGESGSEMNRRPRRGLAIGRLALGENTGNEPIPKSLEGLLYPIVLNNVYSQSNEHEILLPSGGRPFEVARSIRETFKRACRGVPPWAPAASTARVEGPLPNSCALAREGHPDTPWGDIFPRRRD